jgi:hypothetical protein
MTTPEVDQELERLFSVARHATMPDPGARERIRVGLAPRLASGAPATRRRLGQRAWLGFGVAALGVGAVALWLSSGPRANDVSSPAATSAALAPPLPSARAAAEWAPRGEATPAPRPAPVSSSPASTHIGRPTPSLETSKPVPSASRGADPAEELTLVRAMQQALRSGNPGQALALAADHARRFPRGA